MAIEIERKFLLATDVWRDGVVRRLHMVQGYLGSAFPDPPKPRCTVRVRISGDAAFLTIKSATPGIEREEYEYPIPVPDAQRMLSTLAGGVVEKIRHFIPARELTFEIDEFMGDNAGLVVAELELPHADAEFPRPAWLGREVSGLPRYYNVNLVAHPYASWSAAERRAGDAC